ncbi:MAG: biotin--[acetyl-CoA-carboxylase] ligase [Xanthomonadales bacterium]|nr:biotin--[acetyl-CoA-carboxylase] ligase [Xanthomonadales bacterium]
MRLAAETRDALLAALGDSVDRFGAVEVVDSLDSTNAELLRRGIAQADASLLLALEQTAGRGRHGREWRTPAGGQLALSLAVRTQRPLTDWQGLPLGVGVAVADALRRFGIDSIGLKWPNDLLLGDAKCGGILLESRLPSAASHDGETLLVIGVGINRQLDGSMAVDQPVTDLVAALGERTPSLAELAAVVGIAIIDAVDAHVLQGLAAALPRFEQLDVLRGRELGIVHADGSERVGTALGVAEDGTLRVRIAGVEQRLLSADVSVRPRR